MASFAIVPAAGLSRRMGRPKLELPVAGTPLLARLLQSWLDSRVTQIVVVTRRGGPSLRAQCPSDARLRWLEADDPPHMKDSVLVALRDLGKQGHLVSGGQDCWLLAPADLPFLSSAVIDRLLEAGRDDPGAIWVPAADGRRGHPVLFPARLADEVEKLGPDRGINHLVKSHPVRELRCGEELRFEDIDTPEDYERFKSTGE